MISAIVSADLLRATALALGGATFGLALSEAWLYRQRYHDPRDPWYCVKRLKYMAVVRLGIAMAAVMIVVVVSGHLGDPELTYRTPGAIAVFALFVWGMSGILRDDEEILDSNRQHPRRRETDRLS